ncbi:MAG: DUF126 domain-containing protein [Euryarchaeota archaeon]|nr:DUF126 domain-containing protein [Euryarchaeota archaeon]MDE2044340.1 DUF126 domain-containing protein [Thermoplasmata archaeon]
MALSTAPLSFLGEIDPATGKVDNSASELNGQSVRGQVLVFPMARGSTVGPYVIYGAGKRGVGPVAMVVKEADAIVASAAVIAKIPCVDHIDIDLFRQGEQVEVDATGGSVVLSDVKETRVVTAILQDSNRKILLLKRSSKVGSYAGRWAGVSGYLERVAPLEQAYKEVEEEVGIRRDRLTLVREATPVYARHEKEVFVVQPFLFRVQGPKVQLDWEHTEYEWVDPGEIRRRETVPKLLEVWHALEGSEARGKAAPAP